MKKLVLLFFLSLSPLTQATELHCQSLTGGNEKLSLTLIGGHLISGEIKAPETHHLLVGQKSESDEVGIQNYQLYNQSGQAFELALKLKINAPHYCRARYCPPPVDTVSYTAKLSHENGDEYYNCL